MGYIKNYDVLVSKAEHAYSRGEYLQAFLLQSCIIEAVVKDYSNLKLGALVGRSNVLKKKFESFELARLMDDLFLAGKIGQDLYERLSTYRKKRNTVTHQILKYGEGSQTLEQELKAAYEVGRSMKGFIVEDMLKSEKGKSMEELMCEAEARNVEDGPALRAAFKREVDRKYWHDIPFLQNDDDAASEQPSSTSG